MTSKRKTEVEQLLLNAQLRDELEPYLDESLDVVDIKRMPTQDENEYLASMLEWERAPALPISRWFCPELILPRPDRLTDCLTTAGSPCSRSATSYPAGLGVSG